MSNNDQHNDQHDHDDNYQAAYGTEQVAPPLPPTPEYGFWRSLAELEGKAKFQTDRRGNELPPAPDVVDPMHRRNFFQLMGASMALAGVATGCRRYEAEEIVPLAKRPEDQVPGATLQYATALDIGGVGHALVATSFEGRPIKLDGNPWHPYASGAVVPGTQSHAGASTFAQASILNLYDPDRSTSPTQGGKPTSMDAFKGALATLRKALEEGGAILTEATSSPTVQALLQRMRDRFHCDVYEYEPLSWDNERLGMEKAFDKPYRPIAHLDRCEVIVTIDADIFVDHPCAARYSRDWARSRRRNGSLGVDQDGKPKMNRMYSVESSFSHTGAMADHRLGLRSELCLPFVLALDAKVNGSQALGIDCPALKEGKVPQYLEEISKELLAKKTRAVVIAGRRQPPEVHAVVARINAALSAPGSTLDYRVVVGNTRRETHLQSIMALAEKMKAGRVKSLVIVGGNPVYDAPADLDFGGLLKSVGTSVHLSEYQNETSRQTSWHVPKAHFLEAWGDARTWDGTITIAQPLIAPLYGAVSTIDFLSLLLGEDKSADKVVAATHKLDDLASLKAWRQAVHDGFIANTEFLVQNPPPAVGNFEAQLKLKSQRTGLNPKVSEVLEVTFQYGPHAYDGRFANNAWLQETPDFLTKVCWDNFALVGPDTADALGIANNTMIKVSVGNREVEIACYTMPGQANNSICLVLGGGRTHAGRVGGSEADARRVGWNTYKVRTTGGWDFAPDAKVTSLGKSYELASVQEHWDIRTGIIPSVNTEGLQERLPELIKVIDNDFLNKHEAWQAEHSRSEGYFGRPEPEVEEFWDDEHMPGEGKRHLSLFKEKEYAGHRWAMAIDLSLCTGCNSCMVACQAENNVPVVGRKEIINNREMQWIRIDRYFAGSRTEPMVVHQPVGCQQCENAPCEQVCPVGATSHSDEGLNDMAFNRCIGTRYCANNCPYKVRRFNFLDWNKEWREARNKVRRLLFNPEVTVRMRGVMEKCTFCVQRIQNAKIHARAELRQGIEQRVSAATAGRVDGMFDGEVVTACQAACPTEAIVFGDLQDPNSRVTRLHEDRRQYTLLPETYTKPRNKFLARVRNPNENIEKRGDKKEDKAHAGGRE